MTVSIRFLVTFRLPALLRAACALLLASMAPEAHAAKIDHATWSVDAAVAAQRDAERHWIARRAGESAEAQHAREQAIARKLTGIGTVHPPRPRSDDVELLAQLSDGARAQTRARGVSVADALAERFPRPKSTTVSMTLQTAAQGVVSTGGYVFARTPAGSILHSPIAANGTISLAVAPATPIDLFVHVYAPFASQIVSGVAAEAGAVVELRPGTRVPVRLQSDEPVNYAGPLEFSLRFQFGPVGPGVVELAADTLYGAEPAIYLADAHDYTLSAHLDVPWYGLAPVQATFASPELVVSIARGFVLDVAFDDPEALTTGCTPFPDLMVSTDDLLGAVHGLSSGVEVHDGMNRLVGARVAVPKGRPVDVVLNFATGGSACQLETWRLGSARFVESGQERVRLRRRPQPQIAFQTVTGEPLTYARGSVEEVDAPHERQSFFVGALDALQLVAGREYFLELSPTQTTTAPVTRFVAQPGLFTVTVVAEHLVTAKARLLAPPGMGLEGVMELRRGDALVAAFEMTAGNEYDLQVPAGDYLITVSGLGGTAVSPTGSGSVAVLLQERSFTRRLSSAPGQRIDVQLAVPGTGVAFDVSAYDHPLHATARVQGRPVAATWIFPWQVGLLSDMAPLELQLRGIGFADATVALQPTAGWPSVDVAALGGEASRYTGTLRSSAGVPLANSPIQVHAESGLLWTAFSTDAQGRFDLPFVRNSTVAFLAPDAGSDLGRFVRLGTLPPASGDLTLEAVSFATIDPQGPALQRLFGSGDSGYRIVFVAEGYTALHETFTDSNGNGVWDGFAYIDMNGDGQWQVTEPAKGYGERIFSPHVIGPDLMAQNEPFVDLNGDGYPSIDDHAVFVQNAKNYVRSLLATPEIRAGMSFDAYTLFLPSNHTGTDVIGETNQTQLTRDTRFGAQLHAGSSGLSVDISAVEASLAAAMPRRDLQVVLINQPVPVGRVNAYILAIGGVGNTSPNDLVAGHEFGHNPGTLADEYDEFRGTSLGWFGATHHLTHDPDDLDSPWRALLGARLDAPVSIPNSFGIGLFAGGNYQAGGAYRPRSNSRMRHNAAEFNEPSRLRMSKALCRAALSEDSLTLPPRANGGSAFASGFEAPYVMVEACR
jgi:hypothetical protein